MSEPATPTQVIRALAADWRQQKLSYSDVAEMTGYKYQTIANFVSNKKTYFSFAQAQKIARAFGYRIEYLMFGEGVLNQIPDKPISFLNWNQLMSDGLKLEWVMDALKKIATYTNNSRINDLYNLYSQAFTTSEKDVFVANLANANDVLREWEQTVGGME